MSKNNSHPRSRRSQGAKPYDVSKAFVRRVAEHVTSIIPQSLRPSWLNSGSAPELDIPEDADPPIEQELRSSSQQEQSVPPPKRARTHFQQLQQFSEQNDFALSTNKNDLGPAGLYMAPSGVYSHLYGRGPMGTPTASSTPMVRPLLGPPLTKTAGAGVRTMPDPSIIRNAPETSTRSSARLEPQPGPSGLQQERFRPPSSPVIKEQHTDINGEDLSDSSESTSGCSSLVPQGGRHSAAEQSTDNINSRSPAKLLDQPTSFFRRDKSLPQPPADNKRPAFDVSILAPQSNSNVGRDKLDVTTSPFYPGKTCYGGASAYKRINVSPKISNISYESIFNLSASRSPKNRTFNSSMSDVAAPRRIKVSPIKPNSNLASYSDPSVASSVARRILDTMESLSSPVSDCSRIPLDGKRKRPAADDLYDYRSPKVGASSGPPTAQLSVPRVPELLKMKLQESTAAVRRRMQEKKPAWQESRVAYTLRRDNEDTGRHSNKIGRKQREVEDEMPEQVNLPQISLTLTSMPKIDLGFSPFSATSKSSSRPTVAPVMPSPGPSRPSFSSPGVNKDEEDLTLSFTFSAPIFVKEVPTKNNVKPKINGPLSNIPSKVSELKDSKPAPSLAEKFKPAPSLAAMFKPAEGTWVCGVCDIRNKPEVTKCVACCVEKPSQKAKPVATNPAAAVAAPAIAQSFGSKFSNTGKWECSGCMCYNDNSVDKCPACTTPKPGATMAPKPAMSQLPLTTQGFGNKFSNSGKWECSVCMCLNDSAVDKCPSCTAPRQKPAVAPIVKSGFGDQFKKAEGSWECSVCLVINKSTVASKCVSCGSQKPGAVDKTDSPPKTNKLTFAFATSKSEDSPKFTFGCVPDGGKSEPVKVVAASSSFSFGIPASNVGATVASTTSAASFTFGNVAPIKSPDTTPKEEEKKHVTFGAQPTTEAKPVIFGAFGAESPKTSSHLKRSADSELKSIKFGAPSEKPKESPKISFPVSEADLKSDGLESKPDEPSTKRQSFGFNSPKSEETPKTSAPLFSFGSIATCSDTQTGSSNFVYTASPSAPKLKAATPAPALFSFGGSSASTGSGFSNPTLGGSKPGETSFGVSIKPKESEAPKPAEAPKPFSFTSTPSFGAAASPNLGSPMVMTPTGSAPMFGSPKAAAVPMFGASTTSSTPALTTFTASTTASSTFPATTNAVTTFGSASAAPMFGSTSSPMFGAPSSSSSSMFGSSAGSAVSTPAFGSAIKSVTFGETVKPAAVTFGEPKPFGDTPKPAPSNNTGSTAFMFGAKPANNQAPPPAYPFGASSATPSPGGFSFGSNTGAPINSQPSFPFTANNSQPAVENKQFAAFSANSTPSFQAPKQADPSASVFGSNTPMFGQSSTPAFGAPSQQFGEQSSTTFPTPNFGFGGQQTTAPAPFPFNSAQGGSSVVPAAVGFMFGSQQAQSNSQPPTFNPNIRPSFNFTAGAAPTTFQATPSAAGPAPNPVAQRRIKKAMRRIQTPNR